MIKVNTTRMDNPQGRLKTWNPKFEAEALSWINEVNDVVTLAEPNQPQWYIHLEMVNEKHDKFYIVGRDGQGCYVQYGRNGSQGKRCPHKSLSSLAYKLCEKMQKGYVLHTRVPRRHTAYSDLISPVMNVPDLADGNRHTVDLSGISAMFKIVASVCYEDGAYKGFNKDDAYVMTVPTPVVDAYMRGA